MHIEEKALYQVSCYIDRRDMKSFGVTAEDFINRTPLAGLLIKKARQLAKESTEYEWPGCGFSMEMKFFPDMIELVFSERIEDFVFNLEQTKAALPINQAQELQRVITMIQMAEEEADARKIISDFENSIKELNRG